MKKLTTFLAAAILAVALPLQVRAADFLVPVGRVVGLELREPVVTVADFDGDLGADAKASGLRVGDAIVAIGDTPVSSVEEVRNALARSDGSVSMEIRRGSQTKRLKLKPKITEDGPRLGVYLREGITGIGTVTWYDPDTGRFGALGHGVGSADGELMEITGGSAYPAQVASVKKGKSGEPGQLRGSLQSREPLGSLMKNTGQGVFGEAEQGWAGEPVPVAAPGDVHTGDAQIVSTVEGDTVREYSVSILKIYPKTQGNSRNILLKVTDPALLEATGGIVQGMSGSPILQDGKLVGAVTHVLVGDPTTGYGIFIDNMLAAAA